METEYREVNGETCLVSTDGHYIVYPALNGYTGTAMENYNAYITDANRLTNFRTDSGFTSLEVVKGYLEKYFKG